MTSERKREFYVVNLPSRDFEGILNPSSLELEFSPSDRGAVSHALGRKVSPDIRKNRRGIFIGKAMNILDNDYGGAGNFAYEIPRDITDEKGHRVSGEDYKIIQEVFLAQEIADKRGRVPQDCLTQARKYLDFYRKQKSLFGQKQ